MDIIRKDKNMIVYNSENDHIPKGLLSDIETPGSSNQSYRKQKIARKSKEELEQRKQAVLKRLSEKQDLLLETVKQKVSIQKLVRRNMESALSKAPQEGGNKIQIPFLLVNMPEGSNTEIQMNESKHKLLLSSDRKFDLKSENHVFDCLGFADVEEAELKEYINRDLLEFLRSHQSVNSGPAKQSKKESFTPVLL